MSSFYYWKRKLNIGDYITTWLFDKLDIKCKSVSNMPADVYCTGSILSHNNNITQNTIICGSGWHNMHNDTFKGNKNNIIGVRGKLTAKKLNLQEDSIILGDPALLTSYFYKSNNSKQYNYGLVCHWKDYEFFKEKYANTGLHIINTGTNNVEKFMDDLNSCRFIFSTSLHGIIFAHSYGIPAVHIENFELESQNNFKFKDYYSVIDVPYQKIKYDNKFNFKRYYDSITDFSSYTPSNNIIQKIQQNLLVEFNTLKKKLVERDSTINNTKVCLCAIAKNENNYIREWVNHYKKLGFDKIFIFDNNDIDGETFDQVLAPEIDSGYVTIFNVRGLANQQISCYDKFYSSHAKNFDYVAYFDIDEFLFLEDNFNIKEFVNLSIFKNFDGIAVNWKQYDDNNLLDVFDGNYNCLPRFTHAFKEDTNKTYANCRCTKRILRTKLNLTINSSHGAIARSNWSEYERGKNNNLNLCNSSGEKIENNIYIANWTHELAHLKHFRYKTIGEYIKNKLKKGYPTLYKNSGKDLSIEDFFSANIYTRKKDSYGRQLLGKNLDKVKTKDAKNQTKKCQKPVKTESKPHAFGQPDAFLYF